MRSGVAWGPLAARWMPNRMRCSGRRPRSDIVGSCPTEWVLQSAQSARQERALAASPPASRIVRLAARLREELGGDAVLEAPEDVLPFEYDFGLDRHPPELVAFPRILEQVQATVR